MLYSHLPGLLTVWICYCVAQNVDDIEWTNYAVLDRLEKYHLFWKAGEDDIIIKTVVATNGYIGFGISPNGGMQGSDIVVGWISDGNAHFYDCYADGNTQPKLDGSERPDWELLQGYENNTHTTLVFKRKLQTCDNKDFPISHDTSRVIFAYHPSDPGSFDDIQYHGTTNRGSRSILFLQSKIGKEISDENVRYWDVRSPNFTISRNFDSMYWCSIQKAPPLLEKHHIIKVEALLQEGNEAYIHHIVMHQCISKKAEGEKYLQDKGHECYQPNMPEFFSKCGALFVAWGIGSEGMVMPIEAGLPLGANEYPYFLLEVHYDNPSLNDGVVDSSGFRLYYTPSLRKYDAMTMMIGASVSPSVIIPPRQKNFIVAGHGNPDCLEPVMPKEGIKVVSIFLHAHLLGRKIIVRHFRNDTELPPLAVDNNYDFNYQAYRTLHEEITVLPTDQIVVECTYDSTGRSVTTFGGLSTKEEMCIAFILYYPRIARAGSLTGPSLDMIMALTGISQLQRSSMMISWPLALQNHSYIEHLMIYPWTPRYVSIVEDVLRYAPQDTFCYKGDGSMIQMPSLITYPATRFPYKRKENCKIVTTLQQLASSDRITNTWLEEKPIFIESGASSLSLQNTVLMVLIINWSL